MLYNFSIKIKKAEELMRKILPFVTALLFLCGCAGGSTVITEETTAPLKEEGGVMTEETRKYIKYRDMSPEEITASLTLEQKAAQMVQPAVYCVTEQQMEENCYGSILSKYDSVSYTKWQEIVDGFQQAALNSEAGVPYIYGQDDVHGVNYCSGAVIFPHNINVGAANNPDLAYKMGLATADEARLCHMLWNFSPCLAQSDDPRWGRTYESYGSDTDRIKTLGTAYTEGLIEGGVIACAKHFLADGNVVYGTGEDSDADRLIDRGDASLTEEEIAPLLEIYKAQVDAGVQTVMISHSSLNGIKMHENEKYMSILKDDMGFEGFIVSDWNSVQNISPSTYYEQVVVAVNSGIDMLMEVSEYETARQHIITAVECGDIPEERVNDAVTRIIRVKKNAGVFDDPLCENLTTVQEKTGSDEYRAIAEQLVEESMVLLENNDGILPIKSGTTVYITGPAADNGPAQCGGWTLDWNGSPSSYMPGVTTILDGFREKADDYGITITDNPDEADMVLLFVGEKSYAEWCGDTPDLSLCGEMGLKGNAEAIDEAKKIGKPTVACIVAGRNVLIDEYDDDWDSIVMCYLPGSEGQGVADVLCGGAEFRGTLPAPWYSSINDIGTDRNRYGQGYGLTY